MSRNRPPHRGQASTSTSNARRIRAAQRLPAGPAWVAGASSKQRPIQSMEEARDWERLFIGEIKAGRDPRPTPVSSRAPDNVRHVAGLLDAYFERHLKQHFGAFPVKALEDAAVINRFKSDSAYARKVQIATMHKALALLRAAIRRGQAQSPPLIDKSPFHRFGFAST